MLGAVILQQLLLITVLINCRARFMMENGVLKAYGDVKNNETVFIKKINGVSSLDEKSFRRLKNVKKLKIEMCKDITVLLDWVGSYMTDLTDLHLYHNQIESIPTSFENLCNLKKLTITRNKLETPSLDSVADLKNLEELDLSNNNMTSIPESIFKLTDLTRLVISYNQLTSLPESIGNLTKLKVLVIAHNRLTSLPDSIGKLAELVGLDIYNNHLTSLPDSIGNLTNLAKLDIGFNQISSLPNTIGNLKNLTDLTVYNNILGKFPDSIGNLTHLAGLYANKNRLTSLPETISEMTNLTQLNLSYNRLASLPESIGDQRYLLHIILSNNQLKSLPSTFRNMSRMILLDLESNPISDVSQDGLGRIELQRLFGDRVIFGMHLDSSFPKISREDVYKKLSEKQLCWNFEKLKEFRHEPIKNTRLDKNGMINAVNSLAENDKISRNQHKDETGKLDDSDCIVLIEYIEKLHDHDKEYKRWPMQPEEYAELTKNLLGCILERMLEKDSPFDLAIIAEAVRYCPDRQMGDLRQAYHFVMGQNILQDILKEFIKVYIASEKEFLFDLAITPVQSGQNVHVLNHWRHKLGDELGIDPSFITKIGTMGQDPFHDSDGNALDVFFSVFTPEHVIKTLTEAINARKPVMCELARMIHSDSNLEVDQKVEMFTFEESIPSDDKKAKIESMLNLYFKGLTQKAVEYYLFKEDIVISKTPNNESFEISNDTQSNRKHEDDSTDTAGKKFKPESDAPMQTTVSPTLDEQD